MEYQDGYWLLRFKGQEYAYHSNIAPHGELDISKYEIRYLYSPYYTAENDLFPVQLCTVDVSGKKNRSRIGWIVPINVLCNTDEDYLKEKVDETRGFLSLVLEGVLRDLEWHISDMQDRFTGSNFDLLDIYSDSLTIFLFDKHKLNEFERVIPSLYSNGYYVVENPFNSLQRQYYKSKIKNSEIHEQRSSKKYVNVELLPANFTNDNYIRYLFEKILPYDNDPFYRYVSIYQIVEILMDVAFDRILLREVSNYESKSIDKNTLRERFQGLSKEISKIKEIFTGISETNCTIHFREFRNSVETLFRSLSLEEDYGEFTTAMYSLRNRIVHNMRSLINHKNEVEDIASHFEIVMYNFLMHCSFELERYEKIMVVDGKKSLKVNKKRMKDIYRGIK